MRMKNDPKRRGTLKRSKEPMRRCVGCMESKPKRTLLRIVATPDGEVVLDATGKRNGRGAYVCPDPSCVALADKKRAFPRSLNVDVPSDRLKDIQREILELLPEIEARTNR